MQHRETYRTYYLLQICFQLLFWVPFFYQVQKIAGVRDEWIFYIQTIYYLSFAFFELPTGILSDRLGNKKAVLIATAIMIGANIIPVLSANTTSFLIHFCLVALSRSFFSGSCSAWLYNRMKAMDHAYAYKTIEGNARSYALIARTIAWSCAGFLMELDYRWIYMATVLSCAIAFGAAYRLPKSLHSQTDNSSKKASPLDLLRQGLMKQPTLRLALIQGTGIFVMVRVVQVNLFQPILLDKDFSVSSLGVTMSAMTILESIGSKLAGKSTKALPLLTTASLATCTVAITLMMLAVTPKSSTIVLFLLFSFFTGFALPLSKQILNDHISTDEARATILSFESLFNRVLSSIVTLPLAYLVAHNGMYHYLAAVGCLCVLLAITVFIKLRGSAKLVTA